MEALIAAIYLDSDYQTVMKFIRDLWNDLINDKSILDKFLEDELMTLKEEQKLEDDASIGIIITEKVIEYYKSHFNAGENI
jgi:dsRNA-specific ribonuclease